jgi:hypothetical protein
MGLIDLVDRASLLNRDNFAGQSSHLSLASAFLPALSGELLAC